MGKHVSEKNMPHSGIFYAVIGLFETIFFAGKIYGPEMISETSLQVTGGKMNAHKMFRRWKMTTQSICVINHTLLIKWNCVTDQAAIRAIIEIFLVLLRHGQSVELNILYILLLKCLRSTSGLFNRFNYNYRVTFWEVNLFNQFHAIVLFLSPWKPLVF